ncbi:MAG TPA: amino acid permease, partial [Ktedonobacter sp.]|nr:amino acid permease [Ktedonobacter sp.]
TAVGTEVVGIVGLTLLLLIVGAVRGLLFPSHLFSTGIVSSSGYFNLGSWNVTGPFMISFLLGAYTIVGFESAANLAEETENAHRVVPFSMWSAVVLSGIVGFAFLIVLNLTSYDIPALSKSGTPVADIVTKVLGPIVGDIFLVLVTFSIFACGLVIFITATRLTWAMARDQRFPAHHIFSQVSHRTGTPMMATILLTVLIQIVLVIFAFQTNALTNLFGAATLLPTIIYLSTVILYIATRNKLPRTQGFRLGAFEWPIIVLALIWLLFELAIFRDKGFVTPWLYVVVMFAIGVAYFIYMLVAQPHTLETMPDVETNPEAIP